MNVKNILRCFPPALIALMIVCFGYYSWNYHWLADDFQFRAVLKEKTVPAAAFFFFQTVNGRLASHFYLSSVFRVLGTGERLFIVYHWALLLAFIAALAWMLRNYLFACRNKIISFRNSLASAAFLTAFFFFFFSDGKTETWFWISATGVYLVSLLLAFCGFALLFGKQKKSWKAVTVGLVFFLAAGFSESFALMYGILLIVLLVRVWPVERKGEMFVPAISGITGIAAGLVLNAFSPGISLRMHQLPSFHLPYALKNTLHSLAFPFLRVPYLPMKVGLLILFFFYVRFYFRPAEISRKIFFRKSAYVLAFIALSFFIPCYLTSDVVADRMAELGYFAGVFFLFDYFIFSSPKFPHRATL